MRSTAQATPPSCTLGSATHRSPALPPSARRSQAVRALGALTLPSSARWSPYQQHRAYDRGCNEVQVELEDYERQENVQGSQVQVAYDVASASVQAIGRTQSTQVEEIHPGRKRGAIWRCFEKLGVKSHGPVRCVYRNARINSGFPRRNMLPHALACSKVPAFEKHFQRKTYNLPGRDVDAPIGGQGTSASLAEQAPDPQPSEPEIRPATQEEFEDLLGRVFFRSALPFLLIESPALALLFGRVAPHLKLPNRAKLSGIILQRVVEQVRNAMIDKIRLNGAVSIATDCWANVNGSGVLNFMVTAPGMKSYLWRAFDTAIEKHTASYLASLLEDVTEDVTTHTGVMVTGILTDNASNMTAAWKLLEKNIPIFGGGCAAHVFNWLMESLFSKAQFVVGVKDKADKITRKVYDHGQLLEEFRTLQRSMQPESGNRRAQVTPARTRYFTQYACLKSVLTNRDILDDLFRAARHKSLRDNFETAEVETIISSEVFWEELEYAVALIDPIIEALADLESDQASPSRVYELVRWLIQGYADGMANTQRPHQIFGEPTFRSSPGDSRGRGQGRGQRDYEVPEWKRAQVRAQFKQFTMECWVYCRTDAMGIGFLLDHRMDTKLFINGDEEKSIEEACDYAVISKMLERLGVSREGFKADLFAFAAQKKRWSPESKAKNAAIKPSDWWSVCAQQNPLYQKLSLLADIVFTIPTSRAASEQAFSNLDQIHA